MYVITDEKIDAFVKAVDNSPFVLADIADEMNIGEVEAIALLQHIRENQILQLKCIWVPEKKLGQK